MWEIKEGLYNTSVLLVLYLASQDTQKQKEVTWSSTALYVFIAIVKTLLHPCTANPV